MAITEHKLRSKIVTTIAVVVIIFAVVFSLFRLLVPYITGYGDDIEYELTQQLGMKVEIGMVDADIAWLVPRLKLIDVNIYEAKANRLFLHFEEISLSINWLESFRSLKPELGFISLVGLDLNIERDRHGSFIVQGFKLENTEQSAADFTIPEEFNALIENSSMYMIDSTLRWSDKLNNNQKLVFNDVNLALINDAPGHKLSINMSLPDSYGDSIELVMDIEGPVTRPLSWNGKMFAGIENLNLKSWFNDYWQYFEFTGEGQLDANVWIEWQDKKPIEFNAELKANELALHYLDDNVRSWQLDGFSAKAKWKQYKNGWKLDFRELEIINNKRKWPVSSAIAVKMDQKKNTTELKSNFLRIEDMAHLSGLVARFIPLGDFDWNTMVEPYNLHGDLYDIDIYVPLNSLNKFTASIRFDGLSYESTVVPSLKGLDGQVIHENKGTVLKLNGKDVILDFNDLFRNELFVRSIIGDIGVNYDQSGWLIQSDAIILNTEHIETSTYFKVELPVDKPANMDLISQFEKGSAAYTGLYLPTKIMSDELVGWLDNALIDGYIPSGGVIYHGHFKDFPFAQNEGVFEVSFNIENATLQYMPDWPALEKMQAEIQFYGKGMSIQDANGSVFDARFDNTRIDIEDFYQAHVSVDGDINGSLFDVLKFIEQTPLQEVVGTYITGFGVEGDTDLELNLQIPLSTDESTQVTGVLAFKNNSVYLPNENYHFKDFNGQLRFTEKGTWAEKLSANIDGYPFVMDVTTISKNKSPVTHINAKGYLPVKSLLTPAPILLPYMQGETDWEIDLYVPDTAENENSQIDIFVKSDLKGIRSSILGPFSKSAEEQAPFKLHLGIFSDELRAYVKYSNDFKLAANLKEEQWSANIDSPSLKGSAIFMHDFAVDEDANINLEYINISAFEADEDAPKSSLRPMDYPPIEFTTKILVWKNKTFSDVNVQTHRIKTGMEIDHFELKAPGIVVKGDGFWGSSWIHKNITRLNFTLQAIDLGLGLNRLNIAENIKDTKGTANFKWEWNAEPYKFDWNILQGNVKMDLENGSFADIDAGAGRLLGVLNFETIFSLDFRNQVSDGFSFDDMTASFKFSNGHAVTKDLAIESKVADINMQGRVGMADRDYDLKVDVYPKVSNAFTAIGVATGGPILGIGVHLFQKLFGVDEAAGSKSTVTGSWDAPVITEIGKPKKSVNADADVTAEDE